MINIAIVGFGTVGSGVYDVIAENNALIAEKIKQPIAVKYILDIHKPADAKQAQLFTEDINDILTDADVAIVVEAIGGQTPAYAYVKSALQAGKHVVTSNKELIAEKGAELLQIAKEKNVCLLFEASVGGGTPMIAPIYQSLAANKIEKLLGIINGTTNFMLTKMKNDGMSFDECLKIAQDLGYAETPDPSADVDGIDACRKLSVLSSMSFGQHIYPSQIATKGIREVQLTDMQLLSKEQAFIKLIAAASKQNGNIACTVEPMVVRNTHPLSNVHDVFNALVVTGNMTGDVMFYGKGAGKLPTASAVVADIISAINTGAKVHDLLFWEDTGATLTTSAEKSVYYLRLASGNTKAIESQFENAEYIADADNVFFTNALNAEELTQKLNTLAEEGIACEACYKVLQ